MSRLAVRRLMIGVVLAAVAMGLPIGRIRSKGAAERRHDRPRAGDPTEESGRSRGTTAVVARVKAVPPAVLAPVGPGHAVSDTPDRSRLRPHQLETTMPKASQSIAANMTRGAVAGIGATLALSAMSSALYAAESRPNRWREEWARKGKSANRVAVDRLASAAGVDLTKAQTEAAEGALHFGIGGGSGAVYGAIRPHVPVHPIVRGLGFGATLWAVADEGLNPALGLTPGPTAFPWQAHARGLVSHLTFGVATELLLTIADVYRARRAAQ